MVVPSLIAIALMLAVGYVWSSRGFFSSLLNLLVTVAAGAVAFGLWETVALAVIKNVANDNRFLIDVVWGGTLVALFVLAMAVISLTVNAVVRANIKVPKVIDWVGGAVCGLGAGLIVSGITMIGTSQIRTAEIDNIIQFSPVDYANDGYLTRKQMIVPTDTWTAALYSYWSDRSLRETFGDGKTLGAWRPHVADEGHLLRMAEQDVLLRYSLNPKDVMWGGRYTVGRERPANPPKGYTAPTVKDLVGDAKKVDMLDGTTIKGPAYIEGFVVGFAAGAKEKGGQVAIGAGSATLICRNESNDRSIALQPIAVVSQAKGDSLQEGRWRFDTKNFFVGSMGGQAAVPMAFEFLVPDENRNDPAQVWHPIALYVRGVRFDVTNPDDPTKSVKPSNEYLTPADRNAAIEAGAFLKGVIETAAEITGGERFKFDPKDTNQALRLNNRIPGNITLNGGEMSGVELSKSQQIINCSDFRIQTKLLAGNDVERSLRVEEFQPGPGTAVISIEVSRDVPKFSATEPASAGATGAPTLVDDLGQQYPAIGYVYRDRGEVRIRFTPGQPLTSLSDAPSVSRSRDDQKLFLVFRVAPNVKLRKYGIGSTGIVEFQGNVETPTNQQNK